MMYALGTVLLIGLGMAVISHLPRIKRLKDEGKID